MNRALIDRVFVDLSLTAGDNSERERTKVFALHHQAYFLYATLGTVD